MRRTKGKVEVVFESHGTQPLVCRMKKSLIEKERSGSDGLKAGFSEIQEPQAREKSA